MTFVYQLPAWALMWLLAFALYATAKCATVAVGHLHGVSFSRKVAYLFFFPGMNATAFCVLRPVTQQSSPGPRYAANVLTGAALLWGAARLIPNAHPILQGWIGMIGLVLLLHFGTLQLVSLAWQRAGYNAPPLMNQPIRSASVTEFWSQRWNTSFRQLSHQFLFMPLTRRIGPRAALLATFAISGLVHDLVISVPAGAGFGLPTAYFLLQSVGLLFERSRIGRRWLRRPRAARCFAIAVVALPVPLLFHIPFVTRVFLPFMLAIRALPNEVCL